MMSLSNTYAIQQFVNKFVLFAQNQNVKINIFIII
jgi:hypothetical protein